jgi:Flp pilus assembly protein TadB
VLIAQAQLSKRILIALPPIMFVVLNVLNAEYMRPLYSTADGNVLIAIAIGLLMAGSWVMTRMTVITY